MTNIYTAGEDELDLINALVLELATEVDMHYGASDAVQVRKTVATIAAGLSLLKRKGAAVSEDVDAILAKFDPGSGRGKDLPLLM